MTPPLEAVRACLADAVAHVPYYRARAATYDPEHARSRDRFAQVPLLTKEAARAALPLELLSDRAKGAAGTLELLRTSGTGGERLAVWADAEHVGVPAEDLALWDLAPSPRLLRIGVLTSPECFGVACDGTYESRLRNGGAQLILPSTDEPLALERDVAAAIAQELARFDPGELFANPVYLHGLVRACRAFELPMPEPELILLSYQYATKCQRRALAEAFPRARIYSFYGASEFGGATVGIECRYGRMHAWEQEAYVEVVGDDGAPVAEGARGRLAITTVGIWVTPLVRYLVGDLGRVRAEPCGCPLGRFPTLEHHGRERDAIAGGGGRLISTREVDDAIGAPDGLDVWQVVQRGGELEVRCVATPGVELDAAAVAARVEACCGLPARARIVASIDPEPSGKIAHTRRA